jgi:hypothetical protein
VHGSDRSWIGPTRRRLFGSGFFESIQLRVGHPELKQLYAYWLEKKGARLAPARSDIHPTDMRPFLRHVFLLDVLGTPPRLRFRLAGTEVVERYGEELTGRFLDEIDLDEVGGEILGEYDRAIREAQPICSRWNFEKRSGRHLRYERLILPLSSDGHAVDMLLCGACVESRPTVTA